MREAGRIVALTHQELKSISLLELQRKNWIGLPKSLFSQHDAFPSFKGYNGFRGSICTSVNKNLFTESLEIRVLNDGDIISIDIGAKYNGYHGDSAWTYAVGKIDDEFPASTRRYRGSLSFKA